MIQGIDGLDLAGYKSFERIDGLKLGALNILIGPNGAGKSNFLSLFRLLNALTAQGLQTFVGSHGSASAMLRYGPKVTSRFSLSLQFQSKEGLNCYRADLVHVSPDTLMFADEALEFTREGYAKPIIYDLHGGHRESRLGTTIDGGGAAGKTAQFIKYRMDRWRSYHFHDTSDRAAVKQHCEIQDNRFLSTDAGNLAAFLFMLKRSHPDHYRQIRDTIRRAFPIFDDFVNEPSRLDPKTILLTWREAGSQHEFGPHQLSDGTLRFMCLCALLLQPFDHPNAPYAVTIDEPELGLHPAALLLLAGMLKNASKKVQVVVSTQSASLLAAVDEPDAVIVVDRRNKSSTLERLKPERVESWLDEYSLGDIWEKGVIGGRPS